MKSEYRMGQYLINKRRGEGGDLPAGKITSVRQTKEEHTIHGVNLCTGRPFHKTVKNVRERNVVATKREAEEVAETYKESLKIMSPLKARNRAKDIGAEIYQTKYAARMPLHDPSRPAALSVRVPLSKIDFHVDGRRATEHMRLLAESMRNSGQYAPVVVRRTDSLQESYTVQDGALRCLAAHMLGWSKIAVIKMDVRSG